MGHALHQVEHALQPYAPIELARQVSQVQVRSGELLWQGTPHRLCIAGSAANRRTKQSFAVLTLAGKSPVSFQSHMAVPIAALLNFEVLQTKILSDNNKKRDLSLFIDDLVAKCNHVS